LANGKTLGGGLGRLIASPDQPGSWCAPSANLFGIAASGIVRSSCWKSSLREILRIEGNGATPRTLDWRMENEQPGMCNRLAIGIAGATSCDVRVRAPRPGVQTSQ